MKKECLFCLIAQKKIESNIVLEDENWISILDINPLSNGHTLLITKKHYENLVEIEKNDWNKLFSLFKKVTEILNEKYNPKGFNFISNIGEEAFQTIKHLHIHIIPKYKKNEGFVWPKNKNQKT